jgi:predicted  nucleic acid-binding Zn-ribbon protein
MLKSRVVLSAITAGVSFTLSLLILRHFERAVFTGLMGFVASQAAVMVTSSQRDQGLLERQEELRGHVRALQQRRAIAYEELVALQRQQEALLTQLQTTHTAASIGARGNGYSSQNYPAPPLSWNLSAAQEEVVAPTDPDYVPQRLQQLRQEEIHLQQALNETRSAKQKLDLHLTTGQAELKQLQTQIQAQTQQKQGLEAAIAQLEQQQQQSATSLKQLQASIQNLEQQQQKAEKALAQQPQTAPAAQSLQGAISQMQEQLAALRNELSALETQILDRRQEKAELDQALTAQRQLLPTPIIPTPSPISTFQPPSNGTVSSAPPTRKRSRISESVKPPKPISQPEITIATVPAVATATIPAPSNGLGTEWMTFKKQLQPHEFQALCAIALDENPAAVLKKLAEGHLTMPEMLIDTINEQALDTIGDLILETGNDASSTIIAQEYREQVATLIATHR